MTQIFSTEKPKPRILVLTGYGINCDEETKYAFERAGGLAKIVHVNDLIAKPKILEENQILVFPGGFSYGDDLGSGIALANKMKSRLGDKIKKHIEKKRLVLGICNGFQVLTNLGLAPALDGNYGEPQVALVHNDSARYIDRWVDLKFSGKSPWIGNLERMSLPIAHGEGKFYADSVTLKKLNDKGLIAAKYFKGNICEYQQLEANPNGSLEDIAGITDESGIVLGMMPHPERAIAFTHLPNWPLLAEIYKRQGIEIPADGPGMQLFRNGVEYAAAA